MTRWTASDIPSQKGRVAVVTGADGLSYEGALAPTRAGADVVIAGPNPRSGSAATRQ